MVKCHAKDGKGKCEEDEEEDDCEHGDEGDPRSGSGKWSAKRFVGKAVSEEDFPFFYGGGACEERQVQESCGEKGENKRHRPPPSIGITCTQA